MSEGNRSLTKEAWANVKKNYVHFLPNVFIFFLVSLAVAAMVIALDYAIGSVALLLVPFFFAYQMAYKDREGVTMTGVPSILPRFGSYYSSLNFGSYRLIRNALLSYLIAMIAVSIAGGIATAVVQLDQSFAPAINELLTAIQGNDMNAANDVINSAPFTHIAFGLGIVETAALLLSSLYFFYRAVPVPYVPVNVKNAPANLKTAIFRGGKRMEGSRFEKEYWSLLWPVLPLTVAFFALGTYLGTLLFPLSGNFYDTLAVGMRAGIFGYFLAIIAMGFFAPYFLECLILIQEKEAPNYGKYGYYLLQQNLEFLKATQRMRAEQASDLEKTIKDMENGDDVIDVEAEEKPHGEEHGDDGPSSGGPSVDDYGRSDSH